MSTWAFRRTSYAVIALLFFCGLGTSAAPEGSQGQTNDLPAGTARVVTGMFSSVPPLLTLSLAKIDSATCGLNDPLRFDLDIKNMGKVTIALPVSEDKRDLGESRPGEIDYIKATIALHLATGTRPLLGDLYVTYGSRLVPFSTKLLAPGQATTISVLTHCYTADESLASSFKPGQVLEFDVVGELILMRHPDDLGVALRSLPAHLSILAPQFP